MVSCGEYHKALNSNDPELKMEKAKKFYEAEEYTKAIPLLEELISAYRGTQKAERIYYYYAYSHFGIQDYLLAAHYFDSYVENFPNSEKVEECKFMSAYCHYKNSPPYALDQKDTRKAIEKLQVYINEYPRSDRKDSAQKLIGELRNKIEKKAYMSARNYYKRESYKAAIVALGNVLEDYPDTRYKEECLYYRFRSRYELAIKSVESKKKERLNKTIDAYHKFVDQYEDSEYMDKAEELYKKTLEALKEQETVSN